MATTLFANPIMVEDYVDTSKQITKALKCVAFTNMQVGDMMLRKHERLEKRIIAISEEIELLMADVVENVGTQRERRLQLADIEDDIERAEVLGNALMVEELLEELKVLQDEGKREDALCRSLRKALRSRRRVRKEFIREKRSVEDEMRSFNRKQNLIQSLLSTFAKDSALPNDDRKTLIASDAGSTMTDFDESEFVDVAAPKIQTVEAPVRKSLRRTYSAELARPRRFSADEPMPPKHRKPRVRVRRTLSASICPSRPHSLGSVEEEDDEDTADDSDAIVTSVRRPARLVFNTTSASRATMIAPAAASIEPVELEEIHDEQDNFYTYVSDASDDSSSGDSDDDHDVHEHDHKVVGTGSGATTPTAKALRKTMSMPVLMMMPAHDTVVVGRAGVHRVLASEMHALTLSDEVAAAVASVRNGLSNGSSSSVDVRHAPNESTASTPSSCGHVEVALAPSAAAVVAPPVARAS